MTKLQAGAAAIGVLVLVLAGPRILLGPTLAVETVTQRPFIQTVVASGRVVTPHRVAIGVQMAGTVRRIPVAEGQHVLAGAPLIELEASPTGRRTGDGAPPPDARGAGARRAASGDAGSTEA
jgi:multidrug efflux pump subunit AcrA (membrane-fusion protein)